MLTTYRTPEGYRFACRDAIDAKVLWEVWLENVYRVTPALFEGGSRVAVDIGANIGAVSLLAVARGARRVIAFEPEPHNFDQLEKHATFQDWPVDLARYHDAPSPVVPIKLAVGATAGQVGISEQTRDSKIIPLGEGVQVAQMVTLEQAFAGQGVTECDFLKADIEGSEYGMFEAAPSAVIARCRFIAVETHATDDATYGRLVAKLATTHKVETLGRHDVDGGYLYCMRY